MGKIITQGTPKNRERYENYRNGDVETLTFEVGDTHLCYGEDSNGDAYDFCSIGGNQVIHMEGKLSSAEVASAQEIIDDLGF